MRFYRPTIKQPISTYVEAPLEYMQAFLNQKQADTDATRAAVLKEHESYLGVKPGLRTQDYYNEFKQKYGEQFNKLTQDIMSDASKTPLVAQELAKLNSQYKSDPLYTEISKDFVNYTQASQKLAGSDKPYYFKRTSQLKRNPDGTYEQASPEDYMTYTDKGAFDELFNQVAKLKPEVYENNGKKYVSLLNPDGTYSQQEVKTEQDVETLRLQRIEQYLNDSFVRGNTDGSFEFHYRDAAEKLGNPDLALDPAFRRKVYNQVVAPIKQQAYSKISTSETITNLNQATDNTSKGGAGAAGTVTPKMSTIESGTTQAKKAQYTDSSGSPITTISELTNAVKTKTNEVKQAAFTFAKTFNEVTGKNLVTVNDYSNVFNQFKIEGDKLVPKTITPETIALASDYNFKEAYKTYFNKRQEEANIKGYEADIKKSAGVESYDSDKIQKVTEEALIEKLTLPLNLSGEKPTIKQDEKGKYIEVKKDIISKVIDAVFLSPFMDTRDNYLRHYITEEDYKKVQADVYEKLKNTNEGKIYEVLNKANNRLENVELRQLPTNNEQATNLKSLLLKTAIATNAGNFKNLNTNEPINVTDINSNIPRKENGDIDVSTIDVGYFVDPNEGIKAYMTVPMEGSYKMVEFPIDESSMQKIVFALDPTEAARFDLYNQAVKTINSSQGQKGQIKFSDGLEFNFKETTVDDKQQGITYKYKYQDAMGVTQYANSIKDMMKDLFNFYETTGLKTSENLRKLYNDLSALYSTKKIDEKTFNKRMQEAIIAEKASMVNTPMGKQQPQTQDPLGVLGQ